MVLFLYLSSVVDGVTPDITVSLCQLAGHVPVERVAAQDPQLAHLSQLGVLHVETGKTLPGMNTSVACDLMFL